MTLGRQEGILAIFSYCWCVCVCVYCCLVSLWNFSAAQWSPYVLFLFFFSCLYSVQFRLGYGVIILPDNPLWLLGLLWWAALSLLGPRRLRFVCGSTPHCGVPESTLTMEPVSVALHCRAGCQHSAQAVETLLLSKIPTFSQWESRKE